MLAAIPTATPGIVRTDEFRFLAVVYALSMVSTNPIIVGLANLFLIRGGAGASAWLLVLPLWLVLGGGSLLVARGPEERALGALLTGCVVLWLGLVVFAPVTLSGAFDVAAGAAVAALGLAPVVLYAFCADLVWNRDEGRGFRRLGLTFGLAVAALSALWNLILALPALLGGAGLSFAASPIWFLVLFAMFAAAIASSVAFLHVPPESFGSPPTGTGRGG